MQWQVQSLKQQRSEEMRLYGEFWRGSAPTRRLTPFTRFTLCCVGWSDPCAELGANWPPSSPHGPMTAHTRGVEPDNLLPVLPRSHSRPPHRRLQGCAGSRSPVHCPVRFFWRAWQLPKSHRRPPTACSSAVRVVILSRAKAALPIGVPKTLIPSSCHASGPS